MLFTSESPFLFSERTFTIFSENQRTVDHPWCIDQVHYLNESLRNKINRLQDFLHEEEYNGGVVVVCREMALTMSSTMWASMSFLEKDKPTDQPVLKWWVKDFLQDPPEVLRLPDYLHGEQIKFDPDVESKIFFSSENGFHLVSREGRMVIPKIYHQYDRISDHFEKAKFLHFPEDLGVINTLLVVTRYSEDLSWMSRYENHFSLVLNVGKIDHQRLVNHQYKNQGFEAGSCISFLVNNYENLPSRMVFLQGDPFGHIKEEEFKDLLSEVSKRKGSLYLPFASNGHGNYVYFDSPLREHPELDLKSFRDSVFSLEEVSRISARYWHHHGGQFAVSKDRVIKRSKEFYQNLLEKLQTKDDACCMERLWSVLFND